ncbi:hypothetical protein L208DRAFT_1288640 [Tricholoma matsutake]|nr:hypothetical protein L208DRAFT_1288640 [Tricholoma matsutake 945]
MPKLHLKRTPQEEAARRYWRKHKRKENGQDIGIGGTSNKKRRRTHSTSGEARPWASSDEESEVITPPVDQRHNHRSSVNSYGGVHDEELEEQRFREKMFDALQDDEHLDSLEARLNDFGHIPQRWRSDPVPKSNTLYSDGYGTDDIFQVDPQVMDDEEYTEWIRLGMYRRTHAKEYAEHERKRALKAARRAEEQARRAETERLGRVSEEHRKRKNLERETRRKEAARTEYNLRWKELSWTGAGDAGSNKELRFSDIPWPILIAYPEKCDRNSAGQRPVTLEDLTAKDISDFLLATSSPPTTNVREAQKKQRKEILKETFLRFHPDKFEGRFMARINRDEREAVKEAISQVVRALNSLMDANG